MKKRVVITGIGALNALGNNAQESFENAIKGYNGIDEISYFQDDKVRVKMVAELKNFDVLDHFPKRDLKKYAQFVLYGSIAAKEAFKNANFQNSEVDFENFAVIFGSGIGGMEVIASEIEKSVMDKKISPYFVPSSIINMVAGKISIDLGLKGYSVSPVTACASSGHAIIDAYRMISNGETKQAICGGSEATIHKVPINSFDALSTLSLSENKDEASIPFDKNRNGFVMGEGAAALVLEEYESAKARNANIIAEIVGFGATSDAYHMTSPELNGNGIIRAMKSAIKMANIDASQIGYINAHGTSTKINDKVETIAIKEVFADKYKDVLVSSTKSMHGHMLGATSATELVLTALSLKTGKLLPNINLKNQDPECDLNIITKNNQEKEIEYALSNSLGFGGHNCAILLRRYDESKN